MAKKGGVQQLQTEINTNDDLLKFLDRDGLIVLDVYTDWCGPCLAMIGSLKKIKLEQGGDDLHLAVVKCDKIDAFARFRDKSEPTWLLASKGKLVNCAFGANVPFLVDLILKELDTERRTRIDPQNSARIYYELDEMTLVERERYDAMQKIEDDNERIEKESEERRHFEYITFVTDSIMKNSSDMGVTVLMPHVISRDLLKRLSDPADKLQLVAKDKKTVQALREHIDLLDLCAVESMPQYLVDHILNRDVFVVCWKVTDTNIDINEKSVEDYLNTFSRFVWNEEQPTNGNTSILKALSVVIETEIDDDDEMKKENDEIEQVKSREEPKTTDEKETNEGDKENEQEGEIDQSETTIDGQEQPQTNESPQNEQNTESAAAEDDSDVSEMKSKAGSRCSEISTPIAQFASYFKPKRRKEIKIPPIWTPVDKRANAALIYLYFRSMTEVYLPPDPPVERPHLAIIFDAYKYREIMEVIEKYRDDVISYGYFTSDNCKTAQLIANSTFNYHKNPPTIYDKFVLKVAKIKNSELLMALKKLGPCYTSKNTEIGKSECMLFFPPGYKNSSETGAATPIPTDEKPKKKKKKRKTKQGSDEENDNENNQVQNVTQAPADVEAEPEDCTEQDDDDSGEDEDSAEGNEVENLPETTEK